MWWRDASHCVCHTGGCMRSAWSRRTIAAPREWASRQRRCRPGRLDRIHVCARGAPTTSNECPVPSFWDSSALRLHSSLRPRSFGYEHRQVEFRSPLWLAGNLYERIRRQARQDASAGRGSAIREFLLGWRVGVCFWDEAEMARPKRWYNPQADLAVRVVSRPDRDESRCATRWRHPRVAPRMVECLIYPLSDGPGLGLLVFFPPILWMLSLPIFDLISVLEPLTKKDWALGLMVVPVMVPVVFSFSMVFGYALVFLGHLLVSSALGENDHPRWPEWHPADIAEGIFRWFWAALFGAAIGGGPIAVYWLLRGGAGWGDWIVFAVLTMLGAGYAQMALAASLLHENLIAANPVTVLTAVLRIGWGYLRPSLMASLALALAVLGVWGLLYKMPRMWMEAVALWAYWFFVLYLAMVALRMMGLAYHAHALDLLWFRRRPRWTTSSHDGQIYANS